MVCTKYRYAVLTWIRIAVWYMQEYPARIFNAASLTSMSTSADLVTALKSELRGARITYADLAKRIGLAESSVKRMFARGGDLPLSRVDEVARALEAG